MQKNEFSQTLEFQKIIYTQSVLFFLIFESLGDSLSNFVKLWHNFEYFWKTKVTWVSPRSEATKVTCK